MNTAISFVLVVCVSWGLFLSAYIILSTPVVEIRHSTGECVAVYSYSNDYSCSNLPKRYEHVWVK